MTEHERSVLDLAEAWFDSWPSEPDECLPEERALYQGIAAMRAESAPYVPVEMFGDLSVQIMLETRRQERWSYTPATSRAADARVYGPKDAHGPWRIKP